MNTKSNNLLYLLLACQPEQTNALIEENKEWNEEHSVS